MLVQPDSIGGNLGPSQNAQKDTKCKNKGKKLEFCLTGKEIEVIIQTLQFLFVQQTIYYVGQIRQKKTLI